MPRCEHPISFLVESSKALGLKAPTFVTITATRRATGKSLKAARMAAAEKARGMTLVLLSVEKDDAIPPATKNLSSKPGFTLEEVRGDLFKSPRTESLCHCISGDCKLGRGIAKIFRQKFGRIDELKDSGARVGGLAVLKDGDRFVYNLVTKERFSDTPSYESLGKSLEAMKVHCLAHGVESISMPRIGCGLDGLSWPAVSTLIKNVFQLETVRITVYQLEE